MIQRFVSNIGRHKKHIRKCIHVTGQIFDQLDDVLSRQTTLALSRIMSCVKRVTLSRP